jgi:hypothetical protein
MITYLSFRSSLTSYHCPILSCPLVHCAVVRWLSFKNTPLGDMGMRVLSPHISRMQIQVLVLERCGLSDESCPSISSIIKVRHTPHILVVINISCHTSSCVCKERSAWMRFYFLLFPARIVFDGIPSLCI